MKRVGRRVLMSSTSFLTSPWKYPILAPTDKNISSVDLHARQWLCFCYIILCSGEIL